MNKQYYKSNDELKTGFEYHDFNYEKYLLPFTEYDLESDEEDDIEAHEIKVEYRAMLKKQKEVFKRKNIHVYRPLEPYTFFEERKRRLKIITFKWLNIKNLNHLHHLIIQN